MKETLKKKIDVDFTPYRILGACIPSFAHKALTASPEVGLMLPCNVVVRQVEGGATRVEVVNTGDLVGLTATGADFAASPGGYKYDSSTGKIIFNVFGEDGR